MKQKFSEIFDKKYDYISDVDKNGSCIDGANVIKETPSGDLYMDYVPVPSMSKKVFIDTLCELRIEYKKQQDILTREHMIALCENLFRQRFDVTSKMIVDDVDAYLHYTKKMYEAEI